MGEKGIGLKGRGLCYFQERCPRGRMPRNSPLTHTRSRQRRGDEIFENFSYCVIMKGKPNNKVAYMHAIKQIKKDQKKEEIALQGKSTPLKPHNELLSSSTAV